MYPNRCVDGLAPDSLDAPGYHVPFLLEPVLADLEGGQYVRPILPLDLRDLVSKYIGRGVSS